MIPGRKLYREAKFEQSENLNDLRKMLMKEENMRKKLNAVTKMARFGNASQIDGLLEKLKVLSP